MRRWFWLRLLHMAPRDLVDLHGHMQSLEEGLQHLKDCTEQALRLCATIEGAPVRPEVVLDEEWCQ